MYNEAEKGGWMKMGHSAMGITGRRVLLMIWGFGIAGIIGLVLTGDVLASLHAGDAIEERKAIAFPCRIEGTPLSVEYLAAYDGPFVEDGEDREVTGVISAMVHNRSDCELEEVEFYIYNGDKALRFCARNIPAGAECLVLESNAAQYDRGKYDRCDGRAVTATACELLPQQLQIEEVSMGSLRVHNTSAESMSHITLYYKTRSRTDAFYIGGITYTTVIPELVPGQSVIINPYHYAAGYSHVIKATQEDKNPTA